MTKIVQVAKSREELIWDAIDKADWALRQAREDLAAFEKGERAKRSVSTSSGIENALRGIEAALA